MSVPDLAPDDDDDSAEMIEMINLVFFLYYHCTDLKKKSVRTKLKCHIMYIMRNL